MRLWVKILLPFAILLLTFFVACESGDSESEADDDADDDATDDDVTDDDADDDILPDDYVAPWPQSNVEVADYDETLEPGPLRLKAEDYDAWHKLWHQPYYGSTVEVLFTDDTRTDVEKYHGSGDSCIWTGTYLASQAFRYYVTGDPEAKENAIKMVHALDGHLHITGRPGFIARYRGPQDPKVMPENCASDPDYCHIVNDGEYAGDFWKGNTSRDQYTGWFFGMSLAYDLVDDEDMRKMIKYDVTEVLDELISTNWWITDVDGEPTTAAPNVMPNMQLTWSLIGYHITGEERFKQVVQKWVRNDERTFMRLTSLSLMNRYTQHYGNNLGHQTFYNLLRLAKVYLSEDDYEFFKNLFDTQTHRWMRLCHNAFFNAIHMSQGKYTPYPDNDEYQFQLEQDLTEFRPVPNYQYAMFPPPSEIDPFSVWLHDLQQQYPWLEELMGTANPQAKEAYRVPYQCATDFLWQRNPFAISCNDVEMPRFVNPGVDYLVAYWMASYHKFLTKDQ